MDVRTLFPTKFCIGMKLLMLVDFVYMLFYVGTKADTFLFPLIYGVAEEYQTPGS